MLKPNDILDVIQSTEEYIQRGNHYIQNVTKKRLTTLEESENIFVEVTDDSDSDMETAFKYLFKKINKPQKENSEFNIIFSGKMLDLSKLVRNKWLTKFICESVNNKSRFLINEKLRIVKDIVDNLFTVFTKDGKESIKCILKYTLILNADKTYTDIIITPEWYDPSYSCGSNEQFSAFKIFYILATLSEKCIVQPNKLVDLKFSKLKSNEYYTSKVKSLEHTLKELTFNSEDIEDIFNCIYVILEMSNFYTKVYKSSIEFIGSNHLEMAAKRLKVKDQSLRDFLIEEYTWKDNKKKLNKPENINRAISSFMSKLYEIIVKIIFDKINHISKTSNGTKVNFINSISMPLFNEKEVFCYGDFLQYSMSINFEQGISTIITEKIKIYETILKKELNLQNKADSSLQNILTTIKQVFNILNTYKCEQNKFDYLKKVEKTCENKIKFTKNDKILIQIYVFEYKTFINFDWDSFVNNSDQYDPKKMKGLLKMSSNSIFQKYKIDSNINFQSETFKIYKEFTMNIPFSINTFVVHSLLDMDLQKGVKYSIMDQVSYLKLEYLSVEEICSKSISLSEFVTKYHILFLRHNDISNNYIKASNHAIYLLKLEKAWCCNNYIHLLPSHTKKLRKLKNNYINSIIIVQRSIRTILAKRKLRTLKVLAKAYNETILNTLRTMNDLFKDFEAEYNEICKLDMENIDINLLKEFTPTFKRIEEIKESNCSWLQMYVFSKSTLIAQELFKNSKICVYNPNNEAFSTNNCFNFEPILKSSIKKLTLPPFIMKISLENSEDIIFECKSSENFQLWNLESNKDIYKHLTLSKGTLYPDKVYRLFSMDYIVKKIAYSIVNRVPYNFKDLVKECSFVIIIKEDLIYKNTLSKAPLWLCFINYYPIFNLSSHSFYRKVVNEIKNIDRNECQIYLNGPSLRPKDDWLTENVYIELMLLILENERKENDFDFTDNNNFKIVSNTRSSVTSFGEKCWSKINYKTRKYNFKNNN